MFSPRQCHQIPEGEENMVACRLPIFYRSGMTGIYNSSFSSVSVRLPPRFFLRRLTDTCVLGNLPQTGTGFVKIHGSLREIPEGDEKYSRYRSLFFYHSRMTRLGVIFLPFENDDYNSSFSSVSVRCRRAFSFKRRLTDTLVLGNLPKTGTGFVEIHGSLREIPEGDEKYSRYRSLFFYHSRMTKLGVIFLSFENDEVGGSLFFYHSRMTS